MNARTFVLMAAALLSEVIPQVRAEENTAAPKLAECQDALKSIDAEMASSIASFREEVNAGKKGDGWRADVKEAALRWVNDNPATQLPQPVPKDPEARRAAAMASYQRTKDFVSHAKLPLPASVPAARLISRIEALQEQRTDALLRYASELTTFAEVIWLKAETPADLRPVAAAFAAFETMAPNYLAQTNLWNGMGPPIPKEVSAPMARHFAALQDPRRVEAFYTALFTAADDPLVFPNPKSDAEGYTNTRVIWTVLLRNKTPFLTRPRVGARVPQLDAQYDALRVAAGERLNALILENAPAAVFEPALRHFNAFQDSFDPLSLRLPPPRPTGMPPMPLGMQPVPMVFADTEGRTFMHYMTPPNQIHDYHDLLGSRPGQPMRPTMGGGLPWPIQEQQIKQALTSNSTIGIHKTYRQWLDYRRAEESGAAPAETASLWEELRKDIHFLPTELQASIQKRHDLPGAPETAASAKRAGAPGATATPGPHPASPETQPVEELIAALEALATRVQNEASTGQPDHGILKLWLPDLLNEWKIIVRETGEGVAATRPRIRMVSGWQEIAERPDCAILFPLREKAVRFTLAQISSQPGGAADEALPLWKVLVKELEKSALADDWVRVDRLLRLNAAAGLLPRAESVAWSGMAEAFAQAADASKLSPDAGRDQYLGILRRSENASITSLAIQRLKALPRKEPPR